MAKEVVITIHGVNPDRAWQERTRTVFGPYFECVAIHYDDYDSWHGPFRAVFQIACFLGATAFFLGGIFLIWSHLFVGLLLLVAAGASFIISLGLAWRSRSGCAEFIKQEIERICPIVPPHIVAHSLGTYLIGGALKKFPDLRLGNVVLVSSVLPVGFPWQKLLKDRQHCVSAVRNEFGNADLVTKLVSSIRWLVRDLGGAGATGFTTVADMVHTNGSPTASCSQCAASGTVRIHNVPLNEFGHSDQFLGLGHARQLWLPFLWGYSSEEFWWFVDGCVLASKLQEQKRWNEVDVALEGLWSRAFTWTGGRPLADYTHDVVSARVRRVSGAALPAVSTIVEDVKSVLHLVVFLAVSEFEKATGRDENVLRGLNPTTAMVRAVESAVRAYLP